MPMQLLHSLAEWAARFGSPPRPTVLTIGNFDGLHLGHQRIIRRVVEQARALGALAAVVTFDPHPLKVLRPDGAPPLIASLPQRLLDLDQLGLDAALILPFDLELSRLPPADFVQQILVEHLHARAVFVGENFRFGHHQAGDVRLLMEIAQARGFTVTIIPPVICRGEIVSSTAIRDTVRAGEIGRAARLLGHPFRLTGEIRPGSGTGRRAVVPTLNLAPDQELLPRSGVYATETRLESHPGRVFRSVTNVGTRPTFDGTRLSVETYLFDFSEEIASGRMAIDFWLRLREERKFNGPGELQAQIRSDIARARSFFRRLDHARAVLRSHPRHAPEPF